MNKTKDLKFNDESERSSLAEWKAQFCHFSICQRTKTNDDTESLLNDEAQLWVSLTLFTPYLGIGSLWIRQHRPKLQFFNSTRGSGRICCCYRLQTLQLLPSGFFILGCVLASQLQFMLRFFPFKLVGTICERLHIYSQNHSARLLVIKIWYRAAKYMC